MAKKKWFYRLREDHQAIFEHRGQTVSANNLAVRTFKLYRIEAISDKEAEEIWQKGEGESVARCWIFILQAGNPKQNLPTKVRLHINYYQKLLYKKSISDQVTMLLKQNHMTELLYKTVSFAKPISEFHLFSFLET